LVVGIVPGVPEIPGVLVVVPGVPVFCGRGVRLGALASESIKANADVGPVIATLYASCELGSCLDLSRVNFNTIMESIMIRHRMWMIFIYKWEKTLIFKYRRGTPRAQIV
jgi:hypothetical protein